MQYFSHDCLWVYPIKPLAQKKKNLKFGTFKAVSKLKRNSLTAMKHYWNFTFGINFMLVVVMTWYLNCIIRSFYLPKEYKQKLPFHGFTNSVHKYKRKQTNKPKLLTFLQHQTFFLFFWGGGVGKGRNMSVSWWLIYLLLNLYMRASSATYNRGEKARITLGCIGLTT